MPRRWTIFSVAAVVLLAADQLTKLWARAALVFGQPTKFLGTFWDWELSYNPGSAFGLFNTMESAKIFLSIVGVGACIAILVILHRSRDDHGWNAAALGLIFSGALGNVIDRLLFGKVTDFVLWHVGSFRWPQFNVADAALVVGIAILVLDIGKKKEPKRTAS
jgi:signal peptidase II